MPDAPSPARAALVRWTLIALALGFLVLVLVLPLLAVFVEACGKARQPSSPASPIPTPCRRSA